MKYKRQLAALLVCLMALTGMVLASDDYLITLSWLKENLTDWAKSKTETALGQMEKEILDRTEELQTEGGEITELTDAEIDALAAQAAASMQTESGGTSTSTLNLASGAKVTGPLGGGFILESGSAIVNSQTGNDLVNVTAGAAAANEAQVGLGSYYIIGTDNGCGMTITSDTAVVRVLDGAYATKGYEAQYEDIAEELSELGIFRGSNLGFELERVPTRQEALIMLTRLLGEEDEALAFTGTSPFTDLTGWSDGKKYIHYGAAMGYTNGIDAVTFNQYGAASRHVYLTYVLRALGYDDKEGDFVWNTTSDDLAVEIGLMTERQLSEMKQSGFYRDHVALISQNALSACLKDGSMTLGQRLALSGTITWDQFLALP